VALDAQAAYTVTGEVVVSSAWLRIIAGSFRRDQRLSAVSFFDGTSRARRERLRSGSAPALEGRGLKSQLPQQERRCE